MNFSSLKFTQEFAHRFRLWNARRLPKDWPQLKVSRGLSKKANEILEVQDANHLIHILLIDRHARMPRGFDECTNNRDIVGVCDAFDLSPWSHHF